MNVCKKLSGPQILILSKFYEYGLNTKEPLFNSSHSADEWFKIVSDDLGMVDPSIVKDHVIGLNEQHLLSPYLGTSAGPKILSTQLLSSLGIRLCVFLSKNDPDEIVNG
jgi:hypothetical protein